MTTTTGDRRPLQQLEDEQEVNFRRYWRTIAARWWLPAGGLLAGLVIGYLVAISSGKVWQASALIYPGQPLSPSGNAQINSLATLPSTVEQIVHSRSAIAAAAAKSGIPASRLGSEISVQTITGSKNQIKAGQVSLFQIQVTDRAPGKTAAATRSLAQTVLASTAQYADVKIKAFGTELKSIKTQLKTNADRLTHLNSAVKAAGGLAPLDRLVLVSDLDNAITERGTLLTDLGNTQEELAVAQHVEKPQIVSAPVPSKTTARSTRTSGIIGALIGLILGIIAALVWEPLSGRLGRPRTA